MIVESTICMPKRKQSVKHDGFRSRIFQFQGNPEGWAHPGIIDETDDAYFSQENHNARNGCDVHAAIGHKKTLPLITGTSDEG